MRSSVPTSGRNPSHVTSRAPVYLNVYDVTNLNNYLYWLGLGIFHSAIEVYGVEYAFGAHDYSTSGVFEVEPRNCPGFIFRRTISVGTTDKDPLEFREFIDDVARDYAGDSYHLISKNCNHFTNDVVVKLTKAPMPGWVNRLANIGAFCSCLLPESLQVSTVQHTPAYHTYEIDDGEEALTTEEQDDDDDQAQYLLATPNGEAQSLRQDGFGAANVKLLKETA